MASDHGRAIRRRQFAIEALADHPHHVSTVARWRWDEWGPKADPRGSAEAWAARLYQHTRDSIPTTFIALDDGENVVGVVSLTENDLTIRPDLTPWLAGLFVLPQMRGQGLGSALVRHAEAHAASLLVDRLYLFTDTAEHLYRQLGWQVLEHVVYRGKEQTVMVKAIGTNLGL